MLVYTQQSWLLMVMYIVDIMLVIMLKRHQRRKIIRGLKKKKSDSIKKHDGVTYEAGGF